MHRSGTSSVAGTFAKLGATPPKNLLGANPGNPNGHWESAPLIAFHDELLQSAGSVWHDWRAFHDGWYSTPVAQRFAARAKELLAQEFEQSGTFVFKDPRICRFPRFWLDIFKDEGIAPKIVIPLRSPLEVAQSHRSRDRFSIRKGLLLWLRHALDAEAASRDLPRVIFEWDEFLGDWRDVLARAERELHTQFPALTDTTAVEVDRFLVGDLKRERVSERDLLHNPQLHEWVSEAYAALRELARNPGSNSARAALDELRKQFNDACRLFGGVLAEVELANGELIAALDAERQARAAVEAERTAAVQALAAEQGGTPRQELASALEHERHLRASLESERDGLGAQLAAERERLQPLEATLEQERQARQAAEQALHAEQEALLQAGAHHAEAQAALEEQQQARLALEVTRDDIQALLHEANAAKDAEASLRAELEAALAQERDARAAAEHAHRETIAAAEQSTQRAEQEAQQRAAIETELTRERSDRETAEVRRDELTATLQAESTRRTETENRLSDLHDLYAAEQQARETIAAEATTLRNSQAEIETARSRLQSELDQTVARRAEIEAALAHAERENRRLDETMNRLLSSKSWRLTSPLRTVLGWLKRG